MNLTGKQKRVLRSIAQTKKPLFQLGKEGITEAFIKSVADYITKNELAKISVLDTCPSTKEEIIAAFKEEDITCVQVIGKVYVFYRQNTELKDRIELD